MHSLKYTLAVLILAMGGLGHAETLAVDEAGTSALTGGDRPSRGMTMTKVESSWGKPSMRRAPVGDPPITRWEYPDFVVYFEHNRVIHAVLKRS
ncbi:MAG: hypothetical protein P8172_00705 [Gammaproteobacteria bacterium]|jgi:hypothetical protein